MAGVSLPVSRPQGKALVLTGSAGQDAVLTLVESLGFVAEPSDDPYGLAARLAESPAAYQAIVLHLAAIYREELPLISMIKGRMPSVEIWLSGTDGRQALLADAMRLGADGLLSDDGLHRIAVPPGAAIPEPARPAVELASARPTPRRRGEAVAEPAMPNSAPFSNETVRPPASAEPSEPDEASHGVSEPLLTAEELRALLQEHPIEPAGEEA